MMGQRKLTGFEVDKIAVLLNDLDKAAELIGCNDARQYFPDAVDMLASMKTNRTTDGKPYIEPQPEIGDGYRRATEADKWRRDCEAFYRGEWHVVSDGIILGVTHYRVPIDRIPTDEDAKQRPTVMVRNNERMKWKVVKLIMVAEKAEGMHFPFVTIDSLRPDCWACCRFPYPGELD
jgi:hypothetical protein